MMLTKEEIELSLQQKKLQLRIKRMCDVIIAGSLIILLSPLFIVVSVLILFSSRGPVLYTNERIGYRGIHFRCFKFRSMVVHQDYGVLHKVKNDRRVTWIGAIIRKTSIDELPQLFNVLRGEMSMVGPRPLVPCMMTGLPDFNEIRCLVRPGITGQWQIEDREHNTSADYMIKPDLAYISTYTLLSDIRIMIKTPIVVLTAKGAY
jgi:exopolysaccharide production protein ExoY